MDFVIQIAEKKDVDAIYGILAGIDEEINRKDLFISDDKAYVIKHINKQGFIVTATENNHIVAYTAIHFPGYSEENLGYDLNLEKGLIMKCAHMDSVGVIKDYRGYGLQKKLISFAHSHLISQGYEIALATVSPENGPSLNSFLSLGYEIGLTKEKYGGFLRHILIKYL